MLGSNLKTLAAVVVSVPIVLGQTGGWGKDQVNTKICMWPQLRTAVLHDTLYLDGGDIWWQPGLSNGEVGAVVNDNNPQGVTWMLNFSNPFRTSDNFSAVLEPLYGAGGLNAGNLVPNYRDGALLHNDERMYFFGGLMSKTGTQSKPAGDRVRVFEKYSKIVTNFSPQFNEAELQNNITRYITYGGGASAPSENLAWYFTGYKSINGGPIYLPDGVRKNESEIANITANQLITLDITSPNRPAWTVKSLPDFIKGRANPEVVWVPTGAKGILVAIGGVVEPDFLYSNSKSRDAATSKEVSPGFMSTIDIYDIASGQWHQQSTTGGPPLQLTRGCAVVAKAGDGTFNIYYYGGYDGLGITKPESFSDDVWVLSLPKFVWTKLTPGTKEGRAGHKCVMPYPDQMLVIGGQLAFDSNNYRCLDETVRVFNLSTGAWVDRYDPAVWSQYTTPEAVSKAIGGASQQPSPSVAALFASTYTNTITTYYPYASVAPANNTNPDAPVPSEKSDGGGVPSYLPPVLGVVLGLVFITMIAVLVLLYRRRRYLRKNGGSSEAGTEDAGKRIINWMRNQEPKSPPTVTSYATDMTPGSNTDLESSVGQNQQSMNELMNTEVVRPVELMDTSPPAELHDTPLPYTEVINRYSKLGETPILPRGGNGGAINEGSFYSSSGTQQIDHASTVSHPVSAFNASSTGGAVPTPPPPPAPMNDSSPLAYRPDSDALGNPTTPGTGTSSTVRQNIVSGFSQISERDKSHLRQISDATVSSVASGPAGHHHSHSADGRILSPTVPEGDESRFTASPAVVSPPSAGVFGEAHDYLSARGGGGGGQTPQATSSPLRKSVFSESLEDMNGKK
ncbi:RING finger protein B [Podospora fimiseda]|uniref:RING finger protein B n=1 Tax=Podospora fimiseda TaxID=252190 RepID=A0AAN7GV88_9PEZI|nr:RING finger protein B [Podospora fimiseda]